MITPSVLIRTTAPTPTARPGSPHRYVFRLFGRKNSGFPGHRRFHQFRDHPDRRDSVRKLYAPEFGPSEHCPTCTEWQTTRLRIQTEAQLHEPHPAPDRPICSSTRVRPAGAYDPIFSRSKNMLMLNVNFASGNPGAEDHDLQRVLQLHVPDGRIPERPDPLHPRSRFRPIPGDVQLGSRPLRRRRLIRRYRWVLDLQDLEGRDPARNPERLVSLELVGLLNNTSTTIGPFSSATRQDRNPSVLRRGRGHQRAGEPRHRPVHGRAPDVQQGDSDRPGLPPGR